ncbi:ferritin-like domain-containing protein [Hymenobacter properus]|uniref:Ferritin-like domain-containing protein n=1 Tax=Hymenobacter properus TaxID=2791026 RepID=A0A931FJ16_9BACT|nr:ferritin-like domain-containing protein [Hymenobacter properus]MBF9141388.1 ferritin-like domain-containing protein [Hymenobacter properus]MBR7720197.1 ferritin-like domain-containing protein [Microvirga sp. SRT04]
MSDLSHLPARREPSLGRRLFLQLSAASAASVALAAAGCSPSSTPTPAAASNQIVLPQGNQGLLYYAYFLALAQATTYQKVVDAPPSDFTPVDRAVFDDLRDHAVVHRETLKYLIDPTRATVIFPADFAFNLKSFTLTTRAGALAAAQQLEDLVASAYPVILPLFSSTNIYKRTLLLKMSTVQARHAATVRDLLTPGGFASSAVVDGNGQLITQTPFVVLTALAPFVAPYVLAFTCPDTNSSTDAGLCTANG